MKRLFFIVLCFWSCSVAAQDILISIESSLSTFDMNGLKAVQQNFIDYESNAYQVPIKAVNNFPAFWGWGGSAGIKVSSRAFTGISFNYMSTGGRAEYEDFSGYLRFDQLVKSYSYGTFFQYKINSSNALPIFFGFKSSFVRTNLDLNQSLNFTSVGRSNIDSFSSTNYSFKPSIIIRKIINNYFLQLDAGYEFHVKGKLFLDNSNDAYLQDFSRNVVYADWDGFRIMLSAGIKFDIFHKK